MPFGTGGGLGFAFGGDRVGCTSAGDAARDIERVEGDRVILDCSSDQARERWRDESRGRALFEREDQGEMGDRVLNRSFEGTYR